MDRVENTQTFLKALRFKGLSMIKISESLDLKSSKTVYAWQSGTARIKDDNYAKLVDLAAEKGIADLEEAKAVCCRYNN